MKSVLVLLQPLSLAWMLLGAGVVVSLRRHRWRTAVLPGAAWLLLTLTTCTPLASVLLAGFERAYAPVRFSELPAAEAIVCLGGAAEPSPIEPAGIHLKLGADRVSTALALLAQKKAPLLVIGGGGYGSKGALLSEADEVALFGQSLGLGQGGGSASILSLGVCADTHDEAFKVAALVKERGWKRVLLVTSACHMPRAAATFEKAGVPHYPVPCNYMSSVNRVGDLQWLHLPHAESFAIFNTWLHEALGIWHYRRKGWM